MSLNPVRILLTVLFLSAVLASGAKAQTDALSFPASGNVQTVSYVIWAGVGWSFVAKTNIIVTHVGQSFVNGGGWDPNSRITFWTSTNTQLATYTADSNVSRLETGANRVIYGEVAPLPLTAGHVYYITLDLGSNSTPAVDIYTSDPSDTSMRACQTAPGLRLLRPCTYDLNTGTLWFPWPAGAVLLGPTFRFIVAPEASPRLELRSEDGLLQLSWPTNAANYVVETCSALASANWQETTNAPALVGERFVVTNRWSDQARFFRLRSR